MHHLKETVIDGVKFVLIPEALNDALARLIDVMAKHEHDPAAISLQAMWKSYDPEIFNAL